jgi:flagellar motor switch protein FliM
MTIVADELLSQDEIDALLNDDVDVEDEGDEEDDWPFVGRQSLPLSFA